MAANSFDVIVVGAGNAAFCAAIPAHMPRRDFPPCLLQ
jgi:succinate dehydrogenase/fumarate reductase flavoprotein subunit